MAELGQNIMIFAGEGSDTPAMIGGTKANDITNDADMLEKASATQQDYREYEPGRKQWSVSTSFIVIESGHLSNYAAILKTGNRFKLQWRKRSGNSSVVIVEGWALLKTAKYSAPTNNLVQGSFVFQGTGPLAAPST